MRFDNKGQVMILETVFFASTILLSVVFLYQLSPQSVVSEAETNDLKNRGYDALYTLYNDIAVGDFPSGYPSSKLVHCLIANEYGSLVSDLRYLIPSTIMYNIYVTNGEDTQFWCNSYGDPNNILTSLDPVAISHCIVAIDRTFLADDTDNLLRGDEDNRLRPLIDDGYDESVFEVRLELWYI